MKNINKADITYFERINSETITDLHKNSYFLSIINTCGCYGLSTWLQKADR